jgi:hypothetical protein
MQTFTMFKEVLRGKAVIDSCSSTLRLKHAYIRSFFVYFSVFKLVYFAVLDVNVLIV